jgi:hypothetical protein
MVKAGKDPYSALSIAVHLAGLFLDAKRPDDTVVDKHRITL